MKVLLLWDIDGTLISAQGAGLEALRDALWLAFNIRGDLREIELAGRTDRWIFRQILRLYHIEETAAHLSAIQEAYLSALPSRVGAKGIVPLPGICEIVRSAASRDGVYQGLLTGNLRAGARIKLGHGGLWDVFPFGAFADDSENRDELGPFALQRARLCTGAEFEPTRVWVIGDTPHDVRCGKAAGLRTLGIATGRHSVRDLANANADLVLENLEDTDRFWRHVFS